MGRSRSLSSPARMYGRRAPRCASHGDDKMGAALKLFDDLEIQYVLPNEQHRRGPMATSCVGIVDRMIRIHGLPHTTLTLRTIVESSEVNQSALIADIINAVSEVILSHPRWAKLGLEWLAAFDQINLVEIRRTVKAANVWPLRVGIATLIAVKLTEILGPSRSPKPPRPPKVRSERKPPRSLTRIPETERGIALGVELLQLRAMISRNTTFGHAVRSRFDVDQKRASQVMRVARLYATRPEIHRAVSWRTLVELASPKMSPAVRQAFEAKVIAGQKLTAPQIRRSRGPLKGGSPKRRPADQRATRMAA